MSSNLNIAYLAHGTGHGGAGASLIILVRSINDKKIRKYLYVNRITKWKGIESFFKMFEKVELIQLPSIYNDLAGGNTPIEEFNKIITTPFNGFIEKLKEDCIDLIHINTSVFPHIHKVIKDNTNIKIITHVREIIPKYGNGEVQKFMIQQILNYSDAIICISDNEAKPFHEHKNLHVLPNPFDFDEITNINPILRKSFSVKKDTVLIGMFGQFHKMKGQLLFLEILNHIKKQNKTKFDFKFVVIGCNINPYWKRLTKLLLNKPDYGHEFLTYIKKNKLEKHLILIPYVSNVFDYVSELDIVVRPSLSSDPWGRDIIESMALRKPIVATGDSEFYIKNNYSGFLVNKDNIDLISSKINELINDEKLRKLFGDRGRQIIEQKCNINNYQREIYKIYESVKA